MSKPTKTVGAPLVKQVVQSGNGPAKSDEGEVQPKAEQGLSENERLEFQEFENTIRSHLGDFLQIGSALKAICDKKLYREKYPDRFDDYCRQQWGLSDKYAYRLISAFKCVEELRKNSTIVEFPMNESQVRPLLRLDSKDYAKAWKQVLKQSDGSKPTADVVRNVVNTMLGKTDNSEEPKTVKTPEVGDESSPAEQKLTKIAALVTKVLEETPEPSVADLKKILEEIRGLLKSDQ